jgi:DNA-binding NarL/FixJ family response regulator
MQHDLLGVLEATYALGGDDSEWMRALLGRVQNLVEHAEGPARAAAARDVLASAVQDVERARGGGARKDPEQALSLWRALVAGRWSLVDAFEHDGRRYVVAHRNAPSTPATPATLTPREQQVVAYAALGHTNKLIAYELGLATSTVAGHLATASAKMGVASRVELIRRAREDAGSARGA